LLKKILEFVGERRASVLALDLNESLGGGVEPFSISTSCERPASGGAGPARPRLKKRRRGR
jgi:hypothetical protein